MLNKCPVATRIEITVFQRLAAVAGDLDPAQYILSHMSWSLHTCVGTGYHLETPSIFVFS